MRRQFIMDQPFDDRIDAGRVLSERLHRFAGRDDVVVLALPRGGVPVAREVARALDAPLDVLVVRKLGAPGQPELAIGAIASGGVQALSRELIARLNVSESRLSTEIDRQRKELQRRERAYRGSRPFPVLEDKTVLVIDDGLATGSTMEAAVKAIRQHKPRAIVVAVPVAPSQVPAGLSRAADEFIAVHQSHDFMAVGQFYRHFEQVSDDQVRDILSGFAHPAE